jgi:beta-1,4-N-acetylglucosaminyltransferase
MNSDSLPLWKNWIASSFKPLQLTPTTSTLTVYAATATVICTVTVLVFILRAAWIILVEIPATRKRKHLSMAAFNRKSSLPVKTLVVLGSGGHTAEMLLMTKHLDPAHYHTTYIQAATDTTSRQRLVGHHNAVVHDIPRSREVGQSYLSSIFTTLSAQWYCLWLVGRLAPDLILCNGPGTCLPVCLAALFYRIIGFRNNSIVFCESYCRVETLSLTGKLLYPLADLFVVHWPELHQKYPRTVLVSTFVADNKDKDNKGSNEDHDDKKSG